VKKQVKVFGVSVFVALYCFVIGVNSNSLTSANTITQQTNQEHHFSVSSAGIIFHTPQTENTENITNKLPVFSGRNPFSVLWAMVKVTEQLLQNQFSHYGFFLKNFPIKFQKADIIYPFHFFW
jgi:hypothetical protein